MIDVVLRHDERCTASEQAHRDLTLSLDRGDKRHSLAVRRHRRRFLEPDLIGQSKHLDAR